MANITAADVKRLRDATAAGMLDCKRALEEAGGDFDAAVEILRVKGAKDVGKRAGRVAANGLVTALLDGTSAGILVELNCETDFVAKTERFQQVAADIAAAALTHRPADRLTLLRTEVRPGVTAQQLIVEGRLGAFFKDVVLTEQAFVKDPKKTIKQVLSEQGVTVLAFARFQVGQAG